jgi:hypothetical protein
MLEPSVDIPYYEFYFYVVGKIYSIAGKLSKLPRKRRRRSLRERIADIPETHSTPADGKGSNTHLYSTIIFIPAA